MSEPEVRQFTRQFEKLVKDKGLPESGRPADPLRAELYDGIHRKKIGNAYFDLQRQTSAEQLRGCVQDATTSLVLSRTRKLKVLHAEDIEHRALEKLGPGWKTLQEVQNFTWRSEQVAKVVARAVADAAAELLEDGGHTNQRQEAVKHVKPGNAQSISARPGAATCD